MRHLRQRWLAALSAIVLLGLSARAVPAGAEQSNFVPGELVVKLFRAADLAGVAADYKLDPRPLEQFGGFPLYRLRIVDGATPPRRAGQMAGDPRLVYAEPNLIGSAPESGGEVGWAVGGDAGGYATQWAAATVRLPEAHAVTRGSGVTVAVLDTGIDRSHPAFAGRLVQGYDFMDGDTDPSEVGMQGVNPGFGHGTHVAGLVALAAPEAKIMPLRVLNPNGAGNIFLLAEALRYAVDPDGNPATHDGADVVNLSLSTMTRSSLLKDVLNAVTCADPTHRSPADLPCFRADGRGAVVVAAAGNHASTQPEYPAGDGLNGTVAVGASIQTDALAAFSNWGSWVDVEAPGERILSTVPGGGYGVWSGTSMAAPLVAGEAALMRAANPDAPVAKLAQRIVSTADAVQSAVPRRIDAAAALGAKKP